MSVPRTLPIPIGRYGTIIAIIPARNESQCIGDAVDALRRQTSPPNRIVIVVNNCTDQGATLSAAERTGAEIIHLPNCPGKKAGALNAALDQILPTLSSTDSILIQDADTTLGAEFIATAKARLGRRIGAVGGVFYGRSGAGIIGQLQRMEYLRYSRDIDRRNSRAAVLSGTGTLFLVNTLRKIREARRDGRLPGGDGYYSTSSLTEDDEITKAIKTLGWKALSPIRCSVTTDVMATPTALWHQRIRWQRGALENLRDYGLTRITAPYYAQQVMIGIGALAMICYLALMALLFATGTTIGFSPFWTAIMGVFVAERIITVRRGGWRSILIAATIIPELIYDIFQQAVYVRSLFELVRRSEQRWVNT